MKRTSEITHDFDVSAASVDAARQAFEERRTAMVCAKSYGTTEHVANAIKEFGEAAERYAMHMRAHATLIEEYVYPAEQLVTCSSVLYERSMLRSFERGSESANLTRLNRAIANRRGEGESSHLVTSQTKCLAQLKRDVL